jgi:hypothetical protein
MAYSPSDKSSPFQKMEEKMPMKKPSKSKKKAAFGKPMKKRGM